MEENKESKILSYVESRKKSMVSPLKEYKKTDDFKNSNLTGKDLKNADFSDCDFEESIFTDADVLDVIFNKTNLNNSNMTNTRNICSEKLSKAIFENIKIDSNDTKDNYSRINWAKKIRELEEEILKLNQKLDAKNELITKLNADKKQNIETNGMVNHNSNIYVGGGLNNNAAGIRNSHFDPPIVNVSKNEAEAEAEAEKNRNCLII